MSARKRTRFMLGALAALILTAQLALWTPPAAAQVNPLNAATGLIRVISALNRRNRIYRNARDAQRDFNGYYDNLRDKAGEQLISGDLSSLRKPQEGGDLERVRMAAYIRLHAALQAEQTTITRAIDATTNQARRDFNQALVRQLQAVLIQLPGAQQILGQVRSAIANIRATVVAIQTAAADNQPLDVLTERLAQQVTSTSFLQDRVRNLGSALGPELDQALGGALTQVNNSINDITREANQAIQLLDNMDSTVAQYDTAQEQHAPYEVALGPANVKFTDRATAILDVASQALAFLSAAQGTGVITREQIYTQIRTDLLNSRNAALLDMITRVQSIDCQVVGWQEYQAAADELGQTVGDAPPLESTPVYMVCRSKETGEVIRAWPLRVTATGTVPAPSEPEQADGVATLGDEPLFTLDDCGCNVSVAFDPGSSHASSNTHALSTAGGLQFDQVQTLTCAWEEPYKSDKVTALKHLMLEITALPAKSEGDALFDEYMEDAASHLPYCEEDKMCTPELHDSTGERHFHIEKNVYIRGDGVSFDSTHFGYLVRKQTGNDGITYVIEILIDLPELPQSNTQAEQDALALEGCALDALAR